MSDNHLDPEKGLVTSTAHATASSSTNGRTPLQHFEELIGISTPPSLSYIAENVNTKDTTYRNVGLYRRAQAEERSTRIAYKMTSVISNTLYMLQILLAATFTALSAYKDASPVTLTVLGALNTIIAGSLAWQKGQGVPQRYRKAMDQYQALILDMEMTAREFSEGSAGLDPVKERDRLWAKFQVAKDDQQANYPELYVSTQGQTHGATAELEKKIEELSKKLAEKDNAAAGVAPKADL